MQTIDLLPTMADLLGGAPPAPSFQGRSLRALIEGEEGGEVPYAAAFWQGEGTVIAGGRRYWERDGAAVLLDTRSGRVIEGGGDMGRYRELLDSVRGRSSVREGTFDETLRRIRSLGYFQ